MADTQDQTIVESRLANGLALTALLMMALSAGGVGLLCWLLKAPTPAVVAMLVAAGFAALALRLAKRLRHPWMIVVSKAGLVVVKDRERRTYDWARMSKTKVFSSGNTSGVVVFVYDDYGRSLNGSWPMGAAGLRQIVETARLRYRKDPLEESLAAAS